MSALPTSHASNSVQWCRHSTTTTTSSPSGTVATQQDGTGSVPGGIRSLTLETVAAGATATAKISKRLAMEHFPATPVPRTRDLLKTESFIRTRRNFS